MSFFTVKGTRKVRGTLSLPGDKSIAHRCVFIGSLATRTTTIRNFPLNDDCLCTINAFQALGVRISRRGDTVTVRGAGLEGLHPPAEALVIPESGTTFRLMAGVLAGQRFASALAAGTRLSRRPMARVVRPLRLMGAHISGRRNGTEEYAPLSIRGGALTPIRYVMPVASAQVKSAVLLAGLYARGVTTVEEKLKSRDHTERMLELFGAQIRSRGRIVRMRGGAGLVSPGIIRVPGDISSAAFFIVLASIIEDSRLRLTNIGLNPTRTGILTVLRRMGAQFSIDHLRKGPEPSGNICVTSASLRATVVRKSEIPFLIDELPVLMVAAACARGNTVFESAGELRVKETDRIRSMVLNLRKMGVPCRVEKKGREENIIVPGVPGLTGAKVSSFGDHRTAMSMAVAGAKARGTTVIEGVECIDKSFPGFLAALTKLLP